MALTPISSGLPDEVSAQIHSSEKVFYFSYVAFKGGCIFQQDRDDYWIAITDKRVLYKTKVLEINGQVQTFIEKDGILPFDKISFIEVSEGKTLGCNTTQTFQLRISTSGGTVIIPIPTKEKGYEIRRVYTELTNKE